MPEEETTQARRPIRLQIEPGSYDLGQRAWEKRDNRPLWQRKLLWKPETTNARKRSTTNSS